MESGLMVAGQLAAQLMEKTFAGDAIALPFARDVLLAETWIAGTTFESRRARVTELAEGARLALLRRPEHPHDPLAIEIHGPGGDLLGFVPRACNTVPAHLMDAGKLLFARLKRLPGEGLSCRIELYLQDL